MEKKTYNYRQIFSEPVEIQQLSAKISLPRPIKMVSAALFFFVMLILWWLLGDFISHLNHKFPGTLLLIYLGIPYLFVKLADKLKLDGLKFNQYVASRIEFERKFGLTKKAYFQDKLVDVEDDPVVFTKIKRLEVQGED